MPYDYYGDIHGTLDEVLDIYTLENLGIEAENLYTWSCGCKTSLNESPDCDCEIEDENVQSSIISCVIYNVFEHHIEVIKEAIDEILLNFGEDRETFFNLALNPSTENIYNFSQEKLREYKELYALYKFGTMLLNYIGDVNTCVFYFDI